MKKLLLFMVLLPAVFQASAQTAPADTAKKHDQAVSINLGTQGFGAEYTYGILSQINLRAGFAILPVEAKDVAKVKDLNSKNDLSVNFSNIHLMVDLTPFQSFKAFRVVLGAASILNGSGKVSAQPTDTYKYGDITLTQEQVGNLQMEAKYSGIAPYFGLGFGRAIPKNKFGISVDLGTYYLPKPTATVSGTGLFAGNSTQSAQLEKNIEDYRWLPLLQLNLTYKF